MSLKTKSNARIFLDNLYFSVCSILACFFIVYGTARWMGFGFDFDDNIMVFGAVVALSPVLAAYLTYKDIK